MVDSDIATYLAENPRMMGVLFTMVLLLSQAGNAAGNLFATTSGP